MKKTQRKRTKNPEDKKVLKWREFFEPTDFPICVFRMPFHNFYDRTPLRYQLHEHEFDELAIVTGGVVENTYAGKTTTLRRGDVYYIPKGQQHALNCPGSSTAELTNILFDFKKIPTTWWDLPSVSGFEKFFWQGRQHSSEAHQTTLLHLNGENLSRVMGVVQGLEWELAKREHGYKFMAFSYMSRLIGLLSRHASNRCVEANRWTKRLAGLISYIEGHLSESITVEKMSEISGMSPSTLRKAFQETFQESPIHSLQRMKIERSLELMEDAEMSLFDVAEAVGFNDVNYFTRIFKRLMGSSPSQYKKKPV